MLRHSRMAVEHVDRGRAQDPGAAPVNNEHDLDLLDREEAAQSRRRLVSIEPMEIEARRRLGVAARDALGETGASLEGGVGLGVATT